jgi:hypothetical protein
MKPLAARHGHVAVVSTPLSAKQSPMTPLFVRHWNSAIVLMPLAARHVRRHSLRATGTCRGNVHCVPRALGQVFHTAGTAICARLNCQPAPLAPAAVRTASTTAGGVSLPRPRHWSTPSRGARGASRRGACRAGRGRRGRRRRPRQRRAQEAQRRAACSPARERGVARRPRKPGCDWPGRRWPGRGYPRDEALGGRPGELGDGRRGGRTHE